MVMAVSPAFAVWITGLPASGKSTIARALARELAARRVDAAMLESDALRPVLTPHPTYSEEERDTFYGALSFIAALLVSHGVPTIVDATANRRRYRDQARAAIDRFVEVFVDCSLDVCVARDPKGLYRRARAGHSNTVPGLRAPYEPPARPDLVVRGEGDTPETAARRILTLLEERGYVHTPTPSQLASRA
jgi:adenylylsulfate kinase